MLNYLFKGFTSFRKYRGAFSHSHKKLVLLLKRHYNCRRRHNICSSECIAIKQYWHYMNYLLMCFFPPLYDCAAAEFWIFILFYDKVFICTSMLISLECFYNVCAGCTIKHEHETWLDTELKHLYYVLNDGPLTTLKLIKYIFCTFLLRNEQQFSSIWPKDVSPQYTIFI